VRNVLEDELTLTSTMEKVVRTVGSTRNIPSHRMAPRWEQRQGSARGERADLQQTMRSLAPVAMRAPHVFVRLAQEGIKFSSLHGLSFAVLRFDDTMSGNSLLIEQAVQSGSLCPVKVVPASEQQKPQHPVVTDSVKTVSKQRVYSMNCAFRCFTFCSNT
jgi:hypothetical protein